MLMRDYFVFPMNFQQVKQGLPLKATRSSQAAKPQTNPPPTTTPASKVMTQTTRQPAAASSGAVSKSYTKSTTTQRTSGPRIVAPVTRPRVIPNQNSNNSPSASTTVNRKVFIRSVNCQRFMREKYFKGRKFKLILTFTSKSL